MTESAVDHQEATFNPYLLFQGIFVNNYTLQLDCKDSEKLMFALVASYAEADVPPTTNELAERLGWRVSKAQRILSSLRQKELIS